MVRSSVRLEVVQVETGGPGPVAPLVPFLLQLFLLLVTVPSVIVLDIVRAIARQGV
jgi:hypothetical protein